MADIERHRFFLDDSPNSKSAVFVCVDDLGEALLSDEVAERVADVLGYYSSATPELRQTSARDCVRAALTAIGLGEGE